MLLERWPGSEGQVVWLCALGQDRVLEAALSAHTEAWVGLGVPHKISRVKPDNRQGDKFLLGLRGRGTGTVGFMVPGWEGGEGADSCSPQLRYWELKLSLTLPL